MDSLTHVLTGALICDSLPYTRRLGPKAPLAAAIMGAAPDLDMVPAFIANFPPKGLSFFGLFDADWVNRFHRAESHSFFYMALACVPLAWLGWRWGKRRGRIRQWALLFLLCLFSHTILDLTNGWGVRAWMPFSERRSAFGVLPLIDWPILAIAGAVFLLNHVFRDSHPDPANPAPLRYAWREGTAAWLNRHASATAIGAAGLALVVGRIIWALAAAPSLAGWF